ncbi:MAG: DUF1349 domain-containing protein, partial [Chloroflexi bacterium]|nr:DUF1349 domain-containing protein [Chloroflexota bacterium]
RSNTGVDAAGGGNAGGSAPVWLKMERIGNVFTSYHSTDGSSWTQIGTTTIAMGTNVYFGLAVSAHDTPDNGEISTGTFTNVAINPITPSGPSCSSPTGSLLVQINYQPSGDQVPAGYAVDGGDAYGNRGNGFSYGWNSDNTGNARDRDNGDSPDQRYDTFNHMQQGGTFDWEIGVPSGTYEVCLVAGDPNALDSVHRINVEGTLAVDFTPTSDNQWSAGFVTVDVVDGRITVDNAGGSDNNKINFIEIYTVSLAPAADIYVSSTGSGTAGGVGFENQDILVHNVGASSWAMYFDGSDVSLDDSRDIDALFVMSDGSILLSFIRATSIPDVGSVDDSDIVRFTPASTGDTTSGSYSMYFDGSDVNLGSNDEDIDAITVLAADGRIVVSVVGTFNSGGGVKGKDEDLFAFTPTSLGSSTSGSWAIYFDGSDVGLSNSGNEDVKGVWIDDATGDIYLTTKGAFNVPGVSGDENDIFVCSPSSLGSSTSCTYSLYWDGSANGYTDGNMDGLFIDLP